MALRAICKNKEEYDSLFVSVVRNGKEIKGLLAVNPLADGDEVEIAGEAYVYANGSLAPKPPVAKTEGEIGL